MRSSCLAPRSYWSEARRLAAASALVGLTLTGTALGATAPVAGATTPAATTTAALASVPSATGGPTPFSCARATVFLAQGRATMLEAETFGLSNPAGFSDVGTASGWKYNAIAYDSQDNFIYASSLNIGNPTFPTDHLLKIDSTGAVTDLGAFPDEPQGQTAGWVAGTFDQAPGAADDDVYYATDPGTTPSSDLYELPIVDGAPGTAKNLTLTEDGATVSPELFDITFADGYLWGVDDESNDTQIDRIDPATGDVTAVDQSVLPTGSAEDTLYAYGAAWTLGNGDLGFSNNDTGEVYTIAIHDAAGMPTFSLVAASSGPTSPSNSDGTSCPGENVDLGIVKTAPASVLRGGALTYSLAVTNHGPGISSGYSVTDEVPSAVTDVKTSTAGCTVTGNDVTCVEATLAVGATFTITVTGTAPDSAQDVTNSATVTGDEVDPNLSNNSGSVSTAVGSPDVTLTKAVSSSAPPFGGSDTFTLKAVNSGPVEAGKVVVTDVLPSGLKYDSSTASTGSVADSGQTVTWTIPDLTGTAGFESSARLSIVVTVDTTSTVSNTATFTEQVPGPSNTTTGSSNTVSLTPQSAVLELTKTVNDPTPTAESSVTYTVTVTDAGPDAADVVVVTDPLPSGLSYGSSSTADGTASEVDVDGSPTITWDVGTLGLHEAATLEITATVSATSGTLVNTAMAKSTTYDPEGQTRTATATVVVASGAVVPPAHTGVPWSGGGYWALVGGIAAAGASLVLTGRSRRRRRPFDATR
jgi:uncharacterized repeat protein (TIGR01451 family)